MKTINLEFEGRKGGLLSKLYATILERYD